MDIFFTPSVPTSSGTVSATCGSMPNVMGINTAMVIESFKPGSDPTISPITTPARSAISAMG